MNKITEAMRNAGKKVLLDAMKSSGWSPTRAARELKLHDTSTVIRYLQSLAPVEYEKAKLDGSIKRGGDRRKPKKPGDRP